MPEFSEKFTTRLRNAAMLIAGGGLAVLAVGCAPQPAPPPPAPQIAQPPPPLQPMPAPVRPIRGERG